MFDELPPPFTDPGALPAGYELNGVDKNLNRGEADHFNVAIQRELPGQMSIEASYVGSRTRSAYVSNSINSLSLANLALGDPTKGGDPNYLNAQVPNPFEGLLPGTTINGPTVARNQLLRPFPEFTGVTITDTNVGKIWYNSLQVSLQKRFRRGLTFTANYTNSKNIQATSYLNAQDPEPVILVQSDRGGSLSVDIRYADADTAEARALTINLPGQ